MDTADVVIRRSIGLKQDEFTLNGRRVELSDIQSLLESAGFSRSNPYYIVMQGQVAQLTKMTPPERLELLKEVAGTRVYEERRVESVKIMKETGAPLLATLACDSNSLFFVLVSKKEKIEEVLAMLEDRLRELESEKEELSQYRELDRQRRAIEYSLYQSQYQESLAMIQSVDRQRLEKSADVAQTYSSLDDLRAQIQSGNKKLAEQTDALSSIEKERAKLLEEVQVLHLRQAKVSLDLRDKESALTLTDSSKASVAKQLREAQDAISEKNNALVALNASFEAACVEEQKLSTQVAEADGRLKILLARAGRLGQFKSVKERDQWIKKEVNDIVAHIKRKDSQMKDLRARLRELEQRRESNRNLLSSRASGLADRKKAMANTLSRFEEAVAKRDEFNGKRKFVMLQAVVCSSSDLAFAGNSGGRSRKLTFPFRSSPNLFVKLSVACIHLFRKSLRLVSQLLTI